jgi:hypothetical protein
MVQFLTADDLALFATIDTDKAEQMIGDATALAVLAAPCIKDLTDADGIAAVRAIIRGAILRWNDTGTGAFASRSVGGVAESLDTRQVRRGMFWPSEIEQLRDVCGSLSTGQAFDIDTVSTTAGAHADICALNFGGLYCSCGAVLTGLFPLWET